MLYKNKIDEKIKSLSGKNILSYASFAWNLNRAKIPCEFSADLYWYPIHIINYMTGDYSVVDYEEYKSSCHVLIFYLYYILGHTEEEIIEDIRGRGLVDADTAMPYARQALFHLINELHPDRPTPKAIHDYRHELRNIYGFTRPVAQQIVLKQFRQRLIPCKIEESCQSPPDSQSSPQQ